MKQITFPCLNTRLVPVSKVVANDYNPNYVASPEMELLRHSIEQDGLTQPVVTFYDTDLDVYIVVDGFHRYTILKEYFKCPEIPVVVIEKDIKERMASTVRHNRARGKHQVNLMSVLVEKMRALGLRDSQIAKHLGMEAEEVLRLQQQRGIAEYYKARQYSRAWEWVPNDEVDGEIIDDEEKIDG